MLGKDTEAVQANELVRQRPSPFHRALTMCARIALGTLAAATMLASPAHAHDDTGLAGGFAAGMFHPLMGLDHLLAMVSVGLWGTFLGRPLIYALPMLFPLVMAAGGTLGIAGIGFPPVEIGIAVSVVTLGAMILFSLRTSVLVACSIVGIFALFHGYAHGVELPSAADPVGYSAGFVFSTGLLHLLGIAAGQLSSTPVGTIALRSAGGVIAVCGIWFLIAATTA